VLGVGVLERVSKLATSVTGSIPFHIPDIFQLAYGDSGDWISPGGKSVEQGYLSYFGGLCPEGLDSSCFCFFCRVRCNLYWGTVYYTVKSFKKSEN